MRSLVLTAAAAAVAAAAATAAIVERKQLVARRRGTRVCAIGALDVEKRACARGGVQLVGAAARRRLAYASALRLNDDRRASLERRRANETLMIVAANAIAPRRCRKLLQAVDRVGGRRVCVRWRGGARSTHRVRPVGAAVRRAAVRGNAERQAAKAA